LFLIGLFLYAIAATVFLPVPVEPFLVFYPEIDVAIKAVVLGVGKAVGAIAVFYIGFTVNRWLEAWMQRHPRWERVLKLLERFVRKTGWIGLTVLLAIPFMSDTAVNYFYSLLNREGHIVTRWQFVVANFIGGVARAYLFLGLFPWLVVG
jgi:membrane protein YqaA with SNARE-associated domain